MQTSHLKQIIALWLRKTCFPGCFPNLHPQAFSVLKRSCRNSTPFPRLTWLRPLRHPEFTPLLETLGCHQERGSPRMCLASPVWKRAQVTQELLSIALAWSLGFSRRWRDHPGKHPAAEGICGTPDSYFTLQQSFRVYSSSAFPGRTQPGSLDKENPTAVVGES